MAELRSYAKTHSYHKMIYPHWPITIRWPITVWFTLPCTSILGYDVTYVARSAVFPLCVSGVLNSSCWLNNRALFSLYWTRLPNISVFAIARARACHSIIDSNS